MENIFIQRPSVITTFIVPWILGSGCKTPDEAKKYIKYGETLNPEYYAVNNEDINMNGKDSVYSRFMTRLFSEYNIDYKLTQIIGENVYKPWDCLSGIYQFEINDKMGLVARPNGVTKNNECVIMVDDFVSYFYRNITEEEIKIKLLATMAVWNAKKGVCVITKMKKNIYIDFDYYKWEEILCKIKLWGETALEI